MTDPYCRQLRWSVLLLSLALLLAGCVSTQDRYEKAQNLSAEGRYVEAVRYYVRVLEEEPDWTEARDELEAVGQQAVSQLLDEAEALAAEGHYEDAVAALQTLDTLRPATEDVGVTLTVPEDYAEYRAKLIRTAADALIEEGRAAEKAGEWSDAVEAYERAQEYVSVERQALLEEALARVLLHWGEEELAHHHYRSAYERVARIADLVDADHPLQRKAAALRDTAIERGTRVVAFLPLWRTGEAASAMPRFFMRDLNDVLQLDHWTSPPDFIAAVDPIAARRLLRRREVDRTVLSRSTAAKVGRELGADLVLAGEVVRYEQTVTPISEREREARMRVRGPTGQGMQWRDTTYVVQTIRLELEAAGEWRLIDAQSGRTVDRGTIRAQVRDKLQRGIFAGDYRRLDLSGSELSLFNLSDQRQDERAVENQLVDEFATRLADEVFTRILHRID